MLPDSSRNWWTFIFADKVVATMLNANLRNTFKTNLSEYIYKRIDSRLMPDYRAIWKGDT